MVLTFWMAWKLDMVWKCEMVWKLSMVWKFAIFVTTTQCQYQQSKHSVLDLQSLSQKHNVNTNNPNTVY